MWGVGIKRRLNHALVFLQKELPEKWNSPHFGGNHRSRLKVLASSVIHEGNSIDGQSDIDMRLIGPSFWFQGFYLSLAKTSIVHPHIFSLIFLRPYDFNL